MRSPDKISSDAPQGQNRLFTLRGAGRYLGRSEWEMRELIWGRKIPVVQVGRKIYVDIFDLGEFVRRNKSYYD
jgi:hypothetical protein